ncbi:MAG: arginyl-tRNA synthetase [Thermoleophilaceae bacterium]|nr:arginyl-tRNA synthetase [Thermoleophilaceae bacterium]
MDPLSDLRAAIGEKARLERPPKPDFGDYSTNAAMLRAPTEGKPPREVAAGLAEELKKRLGDDVERIDVAGPGFLNLFMSDAWFRRMLATALEQGEEFGRGSGGERVLVEFVSANPTGPMTVASARGAAIGDSLSRVLEFAGGDVEREYYINDYGTQVRLFGESIRARARGEEPPEGGYQGDYVAQLAAEIDGAGEKDPEELALLGVERMMSRVEETLTRFRVRFDRFFSERSMHEGHAIEAALKVMAEHGHVYEHDGATWLRTTSLGDDKDRVLVRSSGEKTYFASDIAYHDDKRRRGYDRVINVLGADHHGHVKRMMAAWQLLGGGEGAFEILIMQLVNLMEGGERARMSKRQGEFVTLDDLLDDIGVDAARFFLLQRSHDTTIDLDLALAREQSSDNPVYYCQYAHARIASILRRADAEPDASVAAELHPSEEALIKRLLAFPEEVQLAAERRAPHRLTVYVPELAQDFSAVYRDCKVVGTPEEGFRLALALQTQRVIARALDVLGVEAPQEM